MSDTNYKSYADRDGIFVNGETVDSTASADQISDTLKFSHLTNSSFNAMLVRATNAKENAIDANRRCRNVRVSNTELLGGEQAAIVVKGGCELMAFENVIITEDPKAPQDILWDDWSDQSQLPSTGSLTNVTRFGGEPVRLGFGRFSKPHIVGGNVEVLWMRTIGLHLYNIGKGVGVKLGLVKLPPGCPVKY